MSKVHSQSRVTDNKGNALFQNYCANHQPQISWRPVSNDDIGIDGEVELYNESGKPLAEILKIQLKSTEKDNSYIKNENPNNKTFTFYAEKAHVEYWQELPNDVLLVICDNRDNQRKLYAKKVENIDLRNTGTKAVPIQFHQELDLIDETKNDFLQRFSRLYNRQNPTVKSVAEGNEVLVSNLLKMSFPTDKIYLAPINYERDEIIKNSWNTDRPLSYKATAREIAWSALNQQGLRFSSDWVTHSKQIISFHDLNNDDLPISRIIEAPIDELSPAELYSVNDDYKRVFKTLLRFCVQQILFKIGYEWRPDEELFRVIAPLTLKDKLEVKKGWKGNKKATRTVFKAKYYEKFKVYYCQHFAFSVDVKDFDNEWFLCINPTWTVSINGERKSQVSHKTVKALKRLERNKSVYNHLRFIVYELSHRDLFVTDYPFLIFHELEKAKTDKVIDEAEWLKTEDIEEITVLEDFEEPTGIKDENSLF